MRYMVTIRKPNGNLKFKEMVGKSEEDIVSKIDTDIYGIVAILEINHSEKKIVIGHTQSVMGIYISEAMIEKQPRSESTIK